VIPKQVEISLQSQFGFKVHSYHPASGGCINSGGTIDTNKGLFFIKWNSSDKYPGMFEKEAQGLETLDSSGALRVPKVVGVGSEAEYAYLLLENVVAKTKSERYWEEAGSSLAGLHRVEGDSFGLNHDNYIGSLSQKNTKIEKWTDFFIQQRLDVQLRLAVSNGFLNAQDVSRFERLYSLLPEIMPDGVPSLLHGDLWGGNLIVDERGMPCFIDPAVYYGNREIELAFTKLFGGFASEFYDSYNVEYVLEPGFDQRVDLYNMYPLLVHVNLFGGGYVSSVRSNLKRYI